MNNPHLKEVLTNFPDVDPASLSWPAGAEAWEAKDLELFIGSGGFLKPKKKKEPPGQPASTAAAAKPAGYPKPSEPQRKEADVAAVNSGGGNAGGAQAPDEVAAGFETPGFSRERFALTMPVRVHCEDTAPHGHVRLESLAAFAERIRSLALKQIMNVSLADLKERKLAILATEFVVEIVGSGIRVLDTLRIDTTPEFPATPLFPWHTGMFLEDGTLYMQGLFGLNLCQISDSGAYSGVDEKGYKEFTRDFLKWVDPSKNVFSASSLRFFTAYKASGQAFKPTHRKETTYMVRSTDCDMYNVLFQGRVPSMMESCHPRYDAMAAYVNIRMSVRPGETLIVHVFYRDEAALFICMREKVPVLTAFLHYSEVRPMSQEEIKCASLRLPTLMKYCAGGAKPPPCDDFDFSDI